MVYNGIMMNGQDDFKETFLELKQRFTAGLDSRKELPEQISRPTQIDNGYIFSIVSGRLEVFEKTLLKLNNRLKKMKQEPIKVTVMEPRLLKYGMKGVGIFYDVKVEGIYPKFDGSQFVGKIEHSKEGIQLFIRKEFESRVTRAECEVPYCEYCKTTRDRKNTFLVEKDGVIYKVGKSCMANFVGSKSLESILHTLAYISELEKGFGESSGGYGVSDSAIGILTKAFAVIDCVGLSKSLTSYVYLLGKPPTKEDYKNNPHLHNIIITEEHELMANECIQWFVNLTEADNFTMNAKVEVIKNGKRSGLIAWGAVKYLEHLGVKAKVEEDAKKAESPVRLSQKLGQDKTKITVTGTLRQKYTGSNQWSEFTVFYFDTEEGDKFSWQTGSIGCNTFSEGDRVKITGTISGCFTLYGGDINTTLIRCKYEIQPEIVEEKRAE